MTDGVCAGWKGYSHAPARFRDTKRDADYGGTFPFMRSALDEVILRLDIIQTYFHGDVKSVM